MICIYWTLWKKEDNIEKRGNLQIEIHLRYFIYLFMGILFIYLSGIFSLACFLFPHLWHMEVPRLGAESELQLLDYTTATAAQDLSRSCDLHHSSRQRRILNPLREASWILVGFITAAPLQELPTLGILKSSF